jgi:hypothetical protein
MEFGPILGYENGRPNFDGLRGGDGKQPNQPESVQGTWDVIERSVIVVPRESTVP